MLCGANQGAYFMRRTIILTGLLLVLAGCNSKPQADLDGVAFDIRFADDLATEAQDGRLLLMLSTKAGAEPRFQVGNNPNSQLIFGVNVEDWDGQSPVRIDSTAIGFPLSGVDRRPDPCHPGEEGLRRRAVLGDRQGTVRGRAGHDNPR